MRWGASTFIDVENDTTTTLLAAPPYSSSAPKLAIFDTRKCQIFSAQAFTEVHPRHPSGRL